MDMQCQYRSKRCPNVRSVKISGELHRFCIFHRWRANATQRRWVQRKQTGETEPSDSDASTGESPTARSPKRTQEAMETPVIKLEPAPATPVLKRRRSNAAKNTKSTKSPHTQEAVALETAMPPVQLQLQSQLLLPVVPLPPVASVGRIGNFPSSMPMTYPVLSEEDFVIFQHLVLETEDDAHGTPHPSSMPPALDVGSRWWDVNYHRHSDDQPSFTV